MIGEGVSEALLAYMIQTERFRDRHNIQGVYRVEIGARGADFISAATQHHRQSGYRLNLATGQLRLVG